MKKLIFSALIIPLITLAQSSHIVNVGAYYYTPETLDILVGDTVFWFNDGGIHDVNFQINSVTNEDFGNPEEIASASLTIESSIGEIGFIVFNQSGIFSYDCSVGQHAANGMVGQIIVNAVNSNTVIDVIVNSPVHNVLEDAVFTANLVGTLSGNGPFTVFAPTDDAFAMIPEDILASLLGDPSGQLTEILLSHVASGNFLSTDISNELVITTLSTSEASVSVDNGVVMINNAIVTVADIITDNGVVHVVDALITFEDDSSDILGCTNSEASNYSLEATIDDSSCIYNIAVNNEITACGGVLYDSGGPGDPYTNYENHSITIYPENDDEYVSLYFSLFDLETCCDYVTIYDGESNTSPVLQEASNGSSLQGLIFYASPLNESGALTLTFTSDVSITPSGWAAEIGCTTYGPCFGFAANVIASFESEEGTSDASASLDIVLGNSPFDILWSTGESFESINNLTAGSYSVLLTDSLGCTAETFFDVVVDPEEYLMGSIIDISSCNGVFYDSGGPDNNFGIGENSFIRICPEEDGTVSQLVFNQFDIYAGTMTIYDGMGTANPILAIGSYTDFIGDTITSSITNSTGCLTISFTSSTWLSASGWDASITCYDYVVYGCMIDSAFNFNPDAEVDDASCYYSPGCTDINYAEYYNQGFDADFDNGDCTTFIIDDCFSESALNYNPLATYNLEDDPCVYQLDDWLCGMNFRDDRDGFSYSTILIADQCWMAENARFQIPDASELFIDAGGTVSQLNGGFTYAGINDYNITDNGRYYDWNAAQSAVPYGWHLPNLQELNILSSEFNGIELQAGGTSGFSAQMSGGVFNTSGEVEYISATNTNSLWSSNEEDESNAYSLTIILDNPDVNSDIIPKDYAISVRGIFGFPEWAILGCTDEDYIEYNPQANYDNGTCSIITIEGCTDSNAINFLSTATFDDGTCIPKIEGCMDNGFAEFDVTATLDDGSCETIAIIGCTDINAQNFTNLANVDDGSCIPNILGCTDSFFVEYNDDATLDDGSCSIQATYGCTDSQASNYNSAANVDDQSCIDFVLGCTDPNYIEFNGLANSDDGTCSAVVIMGCTIDYALNYDSNANTDDGSCQVEGCTNSAFVEFDFNANIDIGTCAIIAIFGCSDADYLEYFPPANLDDGSCLNLIVMGCMNPIYLEFLSEANQDDGSCLNIAQIGCMDPNFIEFDPLATVDINTCLTPIITGCLDELFIEFDELANVENESCETLIVQGCTDMEFLEYNSLANIEDGSCISIILEGCTDQNYIEYNIMSNFDNGSCHILVELGCTNPLAFNYNILANTDDNSCEEIVVGCLDSEFMEYNPEVNTEDLSMCLTPVILGCNDTEAYNYSSLANTDDGSCIFYFAEITFVVYSNGLYQFYSNVEGLGNDFQEYWSFGDEIYSSEFNPLHTYSENGIMEVVLSVNNGLVEIIASTTIEVVNATLGVDSNDRNKLISESRYFDLLGRRIYSQKIGHNQLYIEQEIYIDGSHNFFKRLSY
jgi:uncharacterized protein (TIGR02145 family)